MHIVFFFFVYLANLMKEINKVNGTQHNNTNIGSPEYYSTPQQITSTCRHVM